MPTYRDEPERPRQEPEIIPPDRNSSRGSAWPSPHGFNETQGSHRIYVARIGPLGFVLLMLMVGLFGGVLLLALIGAALIWIPVAVVLVIIAAITGILRRL
jgi:hypothetical protein